MEDLVNFAVAIAVMYGVYRWWSSPSAAAPNEPGTGASRQPSLGFRPKRATHDMVNMVSSAFPQEPKENIHYDLLKTGSVERTINNLLEKGYLERPSAAYFAAYRPPNGYAPTVATPAVPAPANARAQTTKAPTKNLIARYNLQERVSTEEAELENTTSKATWEDTAEKREASLKERKAQMVLAARQRLAAQKLKAASEPRPA
ncbi:hypothetical protein BOTBODRAFT_172775 [Botryobasidium botryosum FD-172 SS1]|uniref:CUE domain-containing protein n=1 Tax=Botryobasidium botryosum (strain FD-172 SS1) TaxID=930990 RepID=A0A067MPL8_BOTB1|nr:hypothetical protein BOTBODRAFT_172775 [Botryobasidium botryosum FD-172 SS1]